MQPLAALLEALELDSTRRLDRATELAEAITRTRAAIAQPEKLSARAKSLLADLVEDRASRARDARPAGTTPALQKGQGAAAPFAARDLLPHRG